MKKAPNVHRLLAIIGFVLGYQSAELARADVLVEVFTEGEWQVPALPGLRIVHHDLLAPDYVRRDRAPTFSANADEAEKAAVVWFASPAGQKYQLDMRNAYRGQEMLVAYRLQKTPAIVFDAGKYVVYGSTDVITAAQLYRKRVAQEAAE